MKRNIFLYSILSIFVFFNYSCKKSLNLAPKGSATTATYYKTEADAKAAVTGAYSNLANPLYRDEIIVTINIVGADDGIPFLTGNAERVSLWRYNFTTTNAFTSGNPWSNSYIGIQRCNVAILRIPSIEMDVALRTRYVAEAKFIRALHYFNLVRLFGGVPTVTTETTSLDDVNVKRNTIDEVYTQIESDLKDAESVLPKNYSSSADIGRATSGAAKSLLAKAYLTRAGNNAASPFWAQAAAKAKEVIDLGAGYDLWANYKDVFSKVNKGGKESVFEIAFSTDLNNGNNFATGYAPRGSPIVPGTGSGILRVSKSLFDQFQDIDQRKVITFLTTYLNPANGQAVSLSITDTDPAKAVSFWKLADSTAKVSGQAGKDFPYLRYSDVLLMYAEALNESASGPNVEAYAALNRVRLRAGISPVSGLNQQQFRNSVLTERRREFCFEGHRWFDLVRTGRLQAAVNAETSFGRAPTIQAFHSLFPIPQREIDANSSLVQNSGY
ncbi:MAG: RagB/SusD family nutrient uptake outer membrane protein [Chitinophagaceae bacterium]